MPTPNPASTPNRIEIFRAGRHVDASGREVHFSADDVAAIAEAYDRDLAEAPLVVGHPAQNAPAYGWATGLVSDSGTLLADVGQLAPEFAEMVRAGRFKKRSASFYHPDSPGNPTPGKWYLRHIGFLGAAAPAVKGLRDVNFAGGDGVLEFSASLDHASWGLQAVRQMLGRLRDYLIETAGAERAQQVISDYELEGLSRSATELTRSEASDAPAFSQAVPAAPSEDPSMSDPVNLAEREAALAEREAVVAAAEQRLSEQRTATARSEAVSFAERLVSEGRLKPARKDAVVELLLAQAVSPINFSAEQGGPCEPVQLLRDVLGDVEPFISFSERSGGSGNDATHVDFAAPAGVLIDGDRLELHRKALAYQATHPNTPYIAAVAAVGG